MENAHFVRRHMEGDPTLKIEDGGDCPRDSTAVDTLGVSTIFIWNAPDALSSALVTAQIARFIVLFSCGREPAAGPMNSVPNIALICKQAAGNISPPGDCISRVERGKGTQS
jgi:hypothetical protein